MISMSMFDFWAKSSGAVSGSVTQSVPHHSLDVAAVAAELLVSIPVPVAVDATTISALIALHDIGKFTRSFQGKVEAMWPAALGPFQRPPAGPAHDAAGFALLWAHLSDSLDPLFREWDGRSERAPVLRAIAGHHGRPPAMRMDPELPRSVACSACIAAASSFLDAVLDLMAPPPLPAMTDRERAAFAWWLAGFTTLVDWIGSSRRWFPPVEAACNADLAAYWHGARAKARRAIAEAGILPARVAAETGMTALFPVLPPRPLQEWAERVALPAGPSLFVIEDATGAGKTEAALVLAHRLLAAGRGPNRPPIRGNANPRLQSGPGHQ